MARRAGPSPSFPSGLVWAVLRRGVKRFDLHAARPRVPSAIQFSDIVCAVARPTIVFIGIPRDFFSIRSIKHVPRETRRASYAPQGIGAWFPARFAGSGPGRACSRASRGASRSAPDQSPPSPHNQDVFPHRGRDPSRPRVVCAPVGFSLDGWPRCCMFADAGKGGHIWSDQPAYLVRTHSAGGRRGGRGARTRERASVARRPRSSTAAGRLRRRFGVSAGGCGTRAFPERSVGGHDAPGEVACFVQPRKRGDFVQALSVVVPTDGEAGAGLDVEAVGEVGGEGKEDAFLIVRITHGNETGGCHDPIVEHA